MTPDEIAAQIAERWFMAAPYMYNDEAPKVIADIATAIRNAYECAAKVIEESGAWEADSIAKDIRALKGEGR